MSDRLVKLFSEVLEVDLSALNDESSPDTIEQWDSLGAMHLVAAVEGEFGVQLSTREIMKMTTIGFAREALRKKGVDI